MTLYDDNRSSLWADAMPGSDCPAEPCLAVADLPLSVFPQDIGLSSGQPGPGEGTFFHEEIDLREPEGTALTERLLELYDGVRPRKRKKGRDNLKLRLRKLAANAMRGHFFRTSPAILYSAASASRAYADKPSWMKHRALAKVVDALCDAGLLEVITGKKMPEGHPTPSWTSSYWATPHLIGLAQECGVTEDSVRRQVSEDSLVRLFEPKPKAPFDTHKKVLLQPAKGKRIKFAPTPETQEWISTLSAVNAFYRQQRIAVGASAAEEQSWLAARNSNPDRRGVPLLRPELFGTDLYRVFNHGNEDDPRFDFGGRLFGGWWMLESEESRKAITINGLPTVELDYANCHPRMLYHQRGHDGVGELYNIPEIAAYEAEKGLAPDTYRDFIKWLFQVLLNGKGRPASARRPDSIAAPEDLPTRQVVSLLKAHHQPIADAFCTGVGLSLMRLESDIALEIVATAMAEGWTVLPVHDSFITTIDKRDRLKALMIESYFNRIGKLPVLKKHN